MRSHVLNIRSVALLLGLFCLLASSGMAGAAQSQEGLPADLVIDESAAPLSEQLTQMQTLHAAAVEQLPKGGILGGIRNAFGNGEERPVYASVGYLTLYPEKLRGALVEAEGIWKPTDDGGLLRSAGYEIRVEFAGGTQPTGFDAVGGPAGMPVTVIGRAETFEDTGILRADAIKPAGLLSGVRIGRIKELQEDWEGAVKAYQQAVSVQAYSARPMGAFARVRAGFLARRYLQDTKLAAKDLSQAWDLYTRKGNEELGYYIWVESPEGGWRPILARDAIEQPLDDLNSQNLAYRIVDLFTRVAGGNAGVGVLLMAIVLRLAIYPLTRKQLVSQRRMATIQPQIKELQKEYATDKQKFQEEFWALCKENDCNPLGGCLPMLVQMPILIFLYRGIRQYIVQFEGVHFLWVQNLASPDMLLLILYTISMVAFQKMAAKSQPTADPAQQQQQQMMAYMMPVMFFFFFQSFPAAFILYWLGSNIFYFGEQALYMRRRPSETDHPSGAAKKQSGFVNSMLDAAKRMGGAEEEQEEESAISYTERRKQEKSKRRGKKGR